MKETNMIDLTHEYKSWISELITRYKQAQIKASDAVKRESSESSTSCGRFV